jgi:hypothetical protein
VKQRLIMQNGALGEHADTTPMECCLRSERPGADRSCARSSEPTCPQAGQEKLSHGTPAVGADRRIEPQGTAAGLARIPDGDDLLRIRLEHDTVEAGVEAGASIKK